MSEVDPPTDVPQSADARVASPTDVATQLEEFEDTRRQEADCQFGHVVAFGFRAVTVSLVVLIAGVAIPKFWAPWIATLGILGATSAVIVLSSCPLERRIRRHHRGAAQNMET